MTGVFGMRVGNGLDDAGTEDEDEGGVGMGIGAYASRCVGL